MGGRCWNNGRVVYTQRAAQVVILLLLLSPCFGYCSTWYVLPDSTGDAPTIQAAIDSCVDGDSVLVAAGIYYVNLQIQSKPNLSLVSESGPEVTILDGTYPANGAQTRWQVIRCQFSPNTLIEGFTIQEGCPDGMFSVYGGGIQLGQGHVTVRNNIIQNCENDRGGAIGFGYNTSDMEGTVIEDNIIRWNSATDGAAGIHAQSVAGPIYIRNNNFTENSGDYAAIKSLFSHFVVEENVCAFNTSSSSCISNVSGAFAARRNVVYHNQGSGIITYGGDLEDNTVVGNTQNGLSGDCYLIRRNIAVNNGGNGIEGYNGVDVTCNDSWGNLGADYYFEDVGDTTGNISQDPLFCAPDDHDYSIASESPCAPEHSGGCGLIGALDVGCVFTAVLQGSVDETNWGAIKKMFR